MNRLIELRARSFARCSKPRWISACQTSRYGMRRRKLPPVRRLTSLMASVWMKSWTSWRGESKQKEGD